MTTLENPYKCVAFIAMKNEETSIGGWAKDIVCVKSWEELLEKMEMWMITYAIKEKLNEFIGAFFYIEDKNQDTQYIVVSGGDKTLYYPHAFSMMHFPLKYHNKKIEKYVREKPGAEV